MARVAPRISRSTDRWTLWLALFALVLTTLTHHGVFNLQFWNDDFLTLRPWSRAEVISALTGSWDPLGSTDPYHRPLTALYQAGLFEVFGLHAKALHAVSGVLLAGISWGLGLFVWRETGLRWLAWWTVALCVIHPAWPDTGGTWVFHQFQLLGCALTTLVLLVWQRRRSGSARGWWPVFALLVVGFYVKEDNLMLLPAVLIAQTVRARIAGDVPAPSRALWGAALLLAMGLLGFRAWLFPHFTYPRFELAAWLSATPEVRNLIHGPYHTLFVIPGGWASHAATVVLSSFSVLGLIAVARAPRAPAASVWMLGASVLLSVDLPLVVTSGPTRDHLVVLAAVLILSASASLLVPWAQRVLGRRASWSLLPVCAIVLASATQMFIGQYVPCSGGDREATAVTLSWTEVPSDLRRYLAGRELMCAAGTARPPVEALGAVMWRVGPWLTDAATGASLRWTTDHAVALVRRDAHVVTISVRHPEATAAAPVVVLIDGDIDSPVRVELRSPEWHVVRPSLVVGLWSRVRSSYRIDVQVSVAPGLGSRGVQIRPLGIE